MKKIRVDKSVFNRILGLSCVENYALYILIQSNYEYRFLYAESFVPFFDVVASFIVDSVSYASFNKIKRIQDIAFTEGLIGLSIFNNLKEGIDKSDYCLIKVSPNYVIGKYGRNLWRDDHYILLCDQNADNLTCLNDNPRDIIEINECELSDAYGGQVISFNTLMEIKKEYQDRLLSTFTRAILMPQRKVDFTIINIEIARDILGIIRTTRKRIKEYCSIYFATDFMAEYIARIDKVYAMCEYMRLRKRVDCDKIRLALYEIQENDFMMLDKLKLEMRGIQ